MVGVSQRLRAQIHRRLPKTYALELAKWAATLGLCLTMPPRRVGLAAAHAQRDQPGAVLLNRGLIRLLRHVNCGR